VNIEQIEFFGSLGDDSVTGGALSDVLSGTAGDDWLFGGDGDDSFFSGIGHMHLFGGGGSDRFFVDDGNIVVDGGQGTDELDLTLTGQDIGVTFSLADTGQVQTLGNGTSIVNMEFLRFEGGSGANNVTGGDLDDVMQGGLGRDVLRGGGGDDDLSGGFSSDRLFGDGGNDVLTAWFDTVGADTLYGGSGVDMANVVPLSAASAGAVPFVFSSDFTLSNGTRILDTEILRFWGSNLGDDVTGGEGSDTLTGNGGNDRLDGGRGADSLVSGSGNDLYVVDDAGDVVNEFNFLGAGTDTVNSYIHFSLTAGTTVLGAVENLTLLGIYDRDATGNALQNRIIGSEGANRIDGLAGSDTLTGGAGADKFVFSNLPFVLNLDQITDFEAGQDQLLFSLTVFGALGAAGPLSPGSFAANADGAATDASD
jgi:Ca2+-binding RTX toxin-like protein